MIKRVFGAPETAVPSAFCPGLRYEEGPVRYDLSRIAFRTTARGCLLDVRLGEGASTAVVDARRVDRILRNLLTNAIEHGAGSPVLVQTAGDEDAVAVVVQDFGHGISPEDARRVFDRFWRADPSRARTLGGTGLGLSISASDAHLHGGWLRRSAAKAGLPPPPEKSKKTGRAAL